MKIGLHYKDNRKVFEEKEIEQVPFLQYPLFENTNIVNPDNFAWCYYANQE